MNDLTQLKELRLNMDIKVYLETMARNFIERLHLESTVNHFFNQPFLYHSIKLKLVLDKNVITQELCTSNGRNESWNERQRIITCEV